MSSVDQWFTDAISMINGADTCAELQKATDHVIPGANELLVNAQADLTKLNSLMVSVTDLPSVINWVNKFVSMISSGYSKVVTEVSSVTTHKAALTAAINNRASTLGCSGIVIPSGKRVSFQDDVIASPVPRTE